MKVLKKIKLNAIAENNLENREMNALRGGGSCGCACAYANQGGSSHADNHSANASSGYHSPGGLHIIAESDPSGNGTYILCDYYLYIRD